MPDKREEQHYTRLELVNCGSSQSELVIFAGPEYRQDSARRLLSRWGVISSGCDGNERPWRSLVGPGAGGPQPRGPD